MAAFVNSWRIIEGDCREGLRTLDAGSVQTCVTSPPYFGLRDYGHDGQVGLEPTPDEFVAALVEVFREVRRVLADDGTLWLNLGDSYGPGKQLLGVPWRVALALQRDGWVLRSDCIWGKVDAMPESVTDRPTKAHEYLFLLAKNERYYYDAAVIREPHVTPNVVERHKDHGTRGQQGYTAAHGRGRAPGRDHSGGLGGHADGRNKRTLWLVAQSTARAFDAHFAVFPPKLIEPCILAGSREGDTVLDPFSGSGTTGEVALQRGRRYIGLEINAGYVDMTRARLGGVTPPLFQEEAA